MKTETENTAIHEAVLLRRIAEGDSSSFRELHQRIAGLVYAIVYKVLNDHQDAEDVSQEIFTQLWKKAHLYTPERGKPMTWISTMARNRAIDRLRSKQRRSRVRDDFQAERETDEKITRRDSADYLVASESATFVRSAVLELSNEQREAIEMAYFGGLTQNEIADRLGQPLGTVKARIRRGMIKLRVIVEESPANPRK